MKRISKILSVLLVAVMLFSFAAVPASALELDSTATIKYVFKDAADGNVITKAAKGDIVWMYVVLNWNKNVLNFQGTFKWDKNVLTLVRKNGSTSAVTSTTQTYNLCGDFKSATQVALTDADGDMFYQDDENNMMGYYTTYGAGTKTFNHKCNIAAWDDAMNEQYQAYTFIYTSNLDDTTNQLLVNTHGEDLEFAQLCFKVNEDTELTEAVISNDAAFSIMNYIDVTDDQSWYFVPYAKTKFSTYAFTPTDATLTIGGAEATVEHSKTMGQMKDWTDTSATTFNAGFVGKISNLTPEFDGKECKTIKSIVVEVTRGDVTLTGNAYQIYAQDDGSYLFRAVVNNASISDDAEISYKYIVTLDDGSELTAEGKTSFKAIYDTAKANYDAANA